MLKLESSFPSKLCLKLGLLIPQFSVVVIM